MRGNVVGSPRKMDEKSTCICVVCVHRCPFDVAVAGGLAATGSRSARSLNTDGRRLECNYNTTSEKTMNERWGATQDLGVGVRVSQNEQPLCTSASSLVLGRRHGKPPKTSTHLDQIYCQGRPRYALCIPKNWRLSPFARHRGHH